MAASNDFSMAAAETYILWQLQGYCFLLNKYDTVQCSPALKDSSAENTHRPKINLEHKGRPCVMQRRNQCTRYI